MFAFELRIVINMANEILLSATEYAMNEGLWGHALFLASKLDKRTHASVMTRFANSLPPHDPLQTLYQLHSGRIPAIVTVRTIFSYYDEIICCFSVVITCFFFL